MSKTILSLTERVELFQHTFFKNKYGENEKKYHACGTVWASVKPVKNYDTQCLQGDGLMDARRVGKGYKVVIRKFHSRYTLQAYLSRLVWNYKILEVVSDWHMNTQTKLYETIAVDTQEVRHG